MTRLMRIARCEETLHTFDFNSAAAHLAAAKMQTKHCNNNHRQQVLFLNCYLKFTVQCLHLMCTVFLSRNDASIISCHMTRRPHRSNND